MPSPVTPPAETRIAMGGLTLVLETGLTSATIEVALAGQLTGLGAEAFFEGGSLLAQHGQTGLAEEAYFNGEGRFSLPLSLLPHQNTTFTLSLCDPVGHIVASSTIALRHRPGTAATDTAADSLSGDLTLEIYGPTGERRTHLLAAQGMPLPAQLTFVGKTRDQSGMLVLPLTLSGTPTRLVVVEEIDRRLPPGCPVECDIKVSVDHALALRILIRQAGRAEIVRLPPPVSRLEPPGPGELEALTRRIESGLAQFSGQFAEQLRNSLERWRALAQGNPERAAEAAAALRRQARQMELARHQIAYPPLQRLTQLVKQCLFHAGELANRTRGDRDALFQQVYAQEAQAERAHRECDSQEYRRALDHLERLASSFEALLREGVPRSARENLEPTPQHAADAVKDLQAYASAVEAMAAGDGLALESLQEIDATLGDLKQRWSREPANVVREARQALDRVAALERRLIGGLESEAIPSEGLLEG